MEANMDNTRRGFTLVEMVIYVGLLALMFVAVVNISLSMSRAYTSLKAAKSLNTSASVVLERITREVRQATSVNDGQSTFGSNPGRLMLNTTESGSATTIEFYLDGGIVKVNKGGVLEGQLSLPSATTTSLIFRKINASSSEAVRITMTVESGENERHRAESFYATVVLRGSY
jgi:type II secretory pathway component PulJ